MVTFLQLMASKKVLFAVLVSGCFAALVIVLNSGAIKGSYFHVPFQQTATVITTDNSKENETANHTRSRNRYMYKDQIDIQLPIRAITLPYEEIITKEWYQELRNILSLCNDSVVLLTCSSEDFLPVLLNWLAAYRLATGSNLSEILVLSIDDETAHRTIIDKGLNSIFIKNDTDIFKINPQLEISSVWMKRLTVVRIMNHLGYDVLVIDLDAMYLKDFTTIIKNYNTSDIVGSMSKMPLKLNSLWGFTMCMGVAYFRSSPGTETFWNAVSNLKHGTEHMQDDQIRTNYGFKELGINWTQNQTCTAHHEKNQCLAKGETAANLTVTLVPHGVVCRHEHCSKDVDTYYIWHVRESFGWKVRFPSGPAWFLDNNWKAAYTKHHTPREIYELIDEITNKTKIKN